MSQSSEERSLSTDELLQLKRWNTPTVYNGWEQITRHDPARDGFNREEVRDFMPEMGTMVGYAATVVIEPGNPNHVDRSPDAWAEYRRYIGELPGPTVVVVQDLDKPEVLGSFWGEVKANAHRALGCVGTITDGAVRDLDEMKGAGFKAMARRLCVGHAHVHPVRWNCEVEVFGRRLVPGQLIHADKHGFLAIPRGEESGLLEAATFMDDNECRTVIRAARETTGKSVSEILDALEEASEAFDQNTGERFGRAGEW